MNAERLTAWGHELREVHQKLRKALDIVRESVENGETAEQSTDLLLFCRGFCAALTGHHKSENGSLFPHIVRTRPDLAPVIAKLSQDHSMIDYLIGGLEHALEKGASTEETLRHLDGIEAVMETHFGYEERQLIEVLDAAVLEEFDKNELFGPLA